MKQYDQNNGGNDQKRGNQGAGQQGGNQGSQNGGQEGGQGDRDDNQR